nr:mitochondrial carrier 2 [Hymenolepis microstoma]
MFDPVDISISEHALFHSLLNPCRVACHLIRIGHEPLPPHSSNTFLHLIGVVRRPLAFYPNAFTYSLYLLKKYGYWRVITCGFFSSFCLEITHKTVTFMINRYIVQRLLDSLEWMDDEDVLSNDQSTLLMKLIGKSSQREFSHLIRYIFIARAYEVFVTQPFFVVMMRQIASLVSGEEEYSWFFQAVVSIYRESGFMGFFSGLVPRMLWKLSRLGMFILIYSLFNRNGVGVPRNLSNNFKFLFNLLADVVVNVASYPLQVVGSVMALHGSRIAIYEVALANSFGSWRECLHSVISQGVQYRGYLPFWRGAPSNALTCHHPSHSTPSAA